MYSEYFIQDIIRDLIFNRGYCGRGYIGDIMIILRVEYGIKLTKIQVSYYVRKIVLGKYKKNVNDDYIQEIRRYIIKPEYIEYGLNRLADKLTEALYKQVKNR